MPKTHNKQPNSPDLLRNIHLDQKHSSRRKQIIQSCSHPAQFEKPTGRCYHHCCRLSASAPACWELSRSPMLLPGHYLTHNYITVSVTRHYQQRQTSPRTGVPMARVSSQSSPREDLPRSMTAGNREVDRPPWVG